MRGGGGTGRVAGMKVVAIKKLILQELADAFRKNPEIVFTYTEEDAKKYGVSLAALESIVSDLSDSGLIKGQFDDHWQITVSGMELVEETEDSGETGESEHSLKARVEQLERRVKALEDATSTPTHVT